MINTETSQFPANPTNCVGGITGRIVIGQLSTIHQLVGGI